MYCNSYMDMKIADKASRRQGKGKFKEARPVQGSEGTFVQKVKSHRITLESPTKGMPFKRLKEAVIHDTSDSDE